MKYKRGDVVIKKTGGNKMTIAENIGAGIYKCYWFVESNLYKSEFKEDDIITISEYRVILKIEERDDILGKILKS